MELNNVCTKHGTKSKIEDVLSVGHICARLSSSRFVHIEAPLNLIRIPFKMHVRSQASLYYHIFIIIFFSYHYILIIIIILLLLFLYFL